MTLEARDLPVDLLRCPVTRERLRLVGDCLVSASGRAYRIEGSGVIQLLAEELCSEDARVQQEHYDRIAAVYLENLGYPHTQEYMSYLDREFARVVDGDSLGTAAEICCGRGEAVALLGDRIERAIGVDVSVAMLRAAAMEHRDGDAWFLQGDATRLPLASEEFDTVVMLGGIHHVNDRAALFGEIARILKPGGRFCFREPVSDFFLWRWLRGLVYRLSPTLDHETESPLRAKETLEDLERAGLRPQVWRTHGFFGFCLFMNSDVLLINKLFRFVPGIRRLTRLSVSVDEWVLRLPGFANHGLIVLGRADKPFAGGVAAAGPGEDLRREGAR